MALSFKLKRLAYGRQDNRKTHGGQVYPIVIGICGQNRMTIEDAWSLSETQKAQLEDADIRPILEKKLKSAVRPYWQEIALESPATKRDPAENELQLIYKKVQLRDCGDLADSTTVFLRWIKQQIYCSFF
ncbi:hypothetical protein AVEN_21036-1 [Araneus ventricosus]|uniref:Uncharacterized protein n=1 Tax=Araneus ventricosus TaxID=182803 RepID=A0A4Y2JCH5_ARAVE|nr:hypothetical protein AVEN_21036-1 [Araneus ventricosus]